MIVHTTYYNLNKVYINNQEFELLDNPIKIFIKSNGFKTHLLNFILKRFECFDYYIFNKNQIALLFQFLLKYVPDSVSINHIYLYNLLLIDYSNSYYTFRHLFNLPVNGQRTWGGGRSIKITNSQLFNYKLKKYLRFTKLNKTFFLAEVINMIWKFQWVHEWAYSALYQKRLPWYIKKKKKFIGIDLMANKQIESFFKHPYKGKKKKHHRKKKVFNKNVITTGFTIGFSFELKKNLF